MGRPKVSPTEQTVRVTIRMPQSMRDGLERMGSAGGDHVGAVSRAVRWLWRRTYSKAGPKGFQSPVIEVRRREYEKVMKELRRLKKERRVFVKATESGRPT